MYSDNNNIDLVFLEFVGIQKEFDSKNLEFYLNPGLFLKNENYLNINQFAYTVSDTVNNGGTVFGSAQGRSGFELKRFLEQLSLYSIDVSFEGDTGQKTITENDILIAGTGTGTTTQTVIDIEAACSADATAIVITADETSDAANSIKDNKKGYFVKIPAKTKKLKIADYAERQILGHKFDDLSPLGTDFERKFQICINAQIPNILQRLDETFNVYENTPEYNILRRLKGDTKDLDDNLFEKTYDYYLKNSEEISKNIDSKNLTIMVDTIINYKNKPSKILVSGNHNAKEIAMRLMHQGFNCQVVGETTTGPLEKDDLALVVSTSGNSKNGKLLAKTAMNLGTDLISIITNPGNGVKSEIVTMHNEEKKGVLYRVPITDDPFEYRRPEDSASLIVPQNSRGDLRPQQNMTQFLNGLVAVLNYKLNMNEKSMTQRHGNN